VAFRPWKLEAARCRGGVASAHAGNAPSSARVAGTTRPEQRKWLSFRGRVRAIDLDLRRSTCVASTAAICPICAAFILRRSMFPARNWLDATVVVRGFVETYQGAARLLKCKAWSRPGWLCPGRGCPHGQTIPPREGIWPRLGLGTAPGSRVIVVYTPVWWAASTGTTKFTSPENPCISGRFGLKEIWTTNAVDFFPGFHDLLG